jgi:hypothetical protein
VNSTLISAVAARDAEREVIFTLGPDAAGLTHGPFIEFRPIADDVATFLAGEAVSLTQSLTDAEIASNIMDVATQGSLATPTLRYSTAAQNFAALRAVYQFATQLQSVMIGDFLNTLTNAQLATAFGITTSAAATLRTNKLAPAAAIATNIRANTGQ